jgi:hypothetical protein
MTSLPIKYPPKEIMSSFSAHGSPKSPIVVWSSGIDKEQDGGNIYFQTKNTFLEFFDDENKQFKGNACSRSFSHDSFFKKLARDNSQATTASNTPSHSRSSAPDSPSESNHSLASHDSRQWMPEMDVTEVSPAIDHWHVDDNSKAMNGNMYGAGKKRMEHTKLAVADPPPANYAGITTLMIRGIPCSFSQEDLLSLVAVTGLGDACDFFYMPRAADRTSNLGYAFINFKETIHAWTCAFTFHGIRLDPCRSSKICTVSPADIQGIPSLRKHFRRAVVSRGPHGPVFLGDKRNVNWKNLMQQAMNQRIHDEICEEGY